MYDTDNSADSDEEQRDDDDLSVDIIVNQDDDSWGVPVSAEDDDLDIFKPSHVPLLQFRDYVRQAVKNYRPLSVNEQRLVNLMEMLRRKGAPLDTVDEVMEWHLKEIGALQGFMRPSDCPDYVSRQVLFERLKRRYNIPREYFMKTKVKLPHSKTMVNVIHFDARDLVVQLLTDPRLCDEDFLHFNDDPLAPPPEVMDNLADINTGMNYRKTYKTKITKPNQMLCPIICYQDGTVTHQFDKLPVEPFKITLGILNRKARDRPEAWRTLGYVPADAHRHLATAEQVLADTEHAAAERLARCITLDSEDSKNEEDQSDIETGPDNCNNWEKSFEVNATKHQDLHRVLATILSSLKTLCENGMQWDYKYKGKTYKNMELVFYIAFVKCDTDEADKLCGHYSSRSRGVKSICRYCTCTTEDLDKPEMQPGVKMKEQHVIQRLIRAGNTEQLKQISQHPIKNVFYDLPFGDHNKMKIHGALPLEMLHQILLGIFPMIRDQFLEQIGSGSGHVAHINDIAKVLGRFIARQSERDFPKTSFSKGIFVSKLTGKEHTGVLLLIAAVLQSTNARSILRDVRSKKFAEENLIDDWVLLVETLLQWEAYLKLDSMDLKLVRRMKKKHSFLMADAGSRASSSACRAA